MNNDVRNGTAFYMAAIDGGYCALKRGTDLQVVYASPKVGQLLHVNTVTKFTDFLSEEDKTAFFNAFKPVGLFSVRCSLRYDTKSFVPVTLKCNTIDDIIYCLITTQVDWYNYAISAMRTKRSYDRLLEYTDSYLFETDLAWNFISYTGKVPQIVPMTGATANLATFLTDPFYVHESSLPAVQRLLNVNTMFMSDNTEKVLIKVDGNWVWFELRVQTVINKTKNTIDGIVGSFININAYQNNVATLNNQLIKDTLTGCFLKAYLFNENVIKTMNADSWILMVDLDDSKRVEEKYGHSAHTTVIKEVATLASNIFKPLPGMVCRYANDEFCIYLPKVSEKKLTSCLDKFMLEVRRIQISGDFCITASIGVAKNSSGEKNMQALIDKADVVSHDIKKRGKNDYQIQL